MTSIDPALDAAITAMLICDPVACPREVACFRIARFARDQLRALHAHPAPESAADPDARPADASGGLDARIGGGEAA